MNWSLENSYRSLVYVQCLSELGLLKDIYVSIDVIIESQKPEFFYIFSRIELIATLTVLLADVNAWESIYHKDYFF